MARHPTMVWAGIGLTLFMVYPGRAQDLTEAALLELLARESPYVRELRGRVSQVAAETQGRALHPNPAFTYSREGAGLTEFMQLEQPLVVSGRLSHLRRASTAAVRSADSTARHALWLLRTEVRLAFYALLAVQEKRQSLGSAMTDLREIVRILQQRENEGEGSRFDRLRGEREVAELAIELVASEVALNELRGRLAAFLPGGVSAGTRALGSLVPAGALPLVEELIPRALSGREDYLAEKHGLERFHEEQRAAERLRIPDPSFLVGVKRAGTDGGGGRRGAVVAVTVPLPLFDRGQSETARAHAEIEQAQARLLIVELQVRAEITAAHATLALRVAGAEAYGRDTNQRGAELIRIARVAYQEGETGILDLLDAYRASRQAQLRLIDLQAAAKKARIDLERALGGEVRP